MRTTLFSLLIGGWMLGALTNSSMAQEKPVTKGNGHFAIAIHGGALDSIRKPDDPRHKAAEQSMTQALTIGRDILQKGGTSLDAVEQVIRFLEDDPIFNAGRGAVFNAAGEHELDASIMDGRTLACGAVAGVRTVRNPISMARLVMTKTPHVLFSGSGADELAKHLGVDLVDNKYFSTPERYEELQREKAKQQAKTGSTQGTVGCVALDQHGNLAAGTSTGGRTNKMVGRVGDSPIVGAGTYADNKTCAVSCTGKGEQFIRYAVAYDISARMAYAHSKLDDAVGTILRERLQPNDGGIIAVGHDGSISMQFNTAGMSRAAADSNGRFEVKFGK